MNRLFLAILLPALLPAQKISCSLAGTVQDSAGAVVPSAKVSLTGQENGFVRKVVTTKDGFFSFPDLTAATFTISIEAAGFKIYKETGILINAGEERSLGRIKLEIGQVSQSVTVSSEAVAINTANGERSGTLSGEQLDQIALRGRDLFDAVSLIPGVVDTSDGRDSPSQTSPGSIYVLGGRNDQKNVTIDGITSIDTGSSGNSDQVMPSMDSVAEVKVLMAAYSAENGRNPASINVITKGGGTQLHGQVAYYFRNEDLNANNFFSNEAGQPRQEYRYNIADYYISGPVVLPKIYRGKKNLFFFFSQEFQNQVVEYPVEESTVPTALERQGNFSKSVNTNGSPITIQDPLNGKQPFPGNIIPASRINPIGTAILNIFPLPNFVDPNLATRYNWNYYIAASDPYNRRMDTIRLDYSPKQNWQIYGSIVNKSDHQEVPYTGSAGSTYFVLSPSLNVRPGRLITLHSTNTITPTWFNEASFGISQIAPTYTFEFPNLVDRTNLGIDLPMRNPSINPLNIIPKITFGGIANAAIVNYANNTPYYNSNTIYNFTDNMSKVRGSHVFKMGIYFEHTQKIQSSSVPNMGSISFSADANNPNDANNAYANALLGNYDNYSEPLSAPQANFLFTNTEWFFQDDWKMKSNLTINWGVRFYHDPPMYDGRHYMASFTPSAWNPATAPVLIRPAVVNGANAWIDPITGNKYTVAQAGLFVPGLGNTADGMLIGGENGVPGGGLSTAPVSVAPRFGFAWDPFGNGKTAIRAGGGVYFDRIEGGPGFSLAANPPTVYSPTTYYGSFSDIASSASSSFIGPGTAYSFSSVPHQQQVYNYNLSVDRRIGSSVFSLGYTGSLGRHLLWERNINAVPPGADFLNLNPQNKNPQNSSALSTNFLRPYSAYGDLYLYEFANNSSYNALLFSFQHRLSHGMNVAASYAYSKALDFADLYSNAVDPFLDPRSRNYGPAAFNRTSVFTCTYYYSIPKPGQMTGSRIVGLVGDNWELAGVTRILTGGPLTPTYSLVTGINAPTGTPSDTARLEVINPTGPLTSRFGPPLEPAGQATAAQAAWLSTSTAPQFGNLGQNTVTGPGTNNWDISLYRVFPFKEGRIKAMLRLETYNTFNHTQFNAINSTAQFNNLGTQLNAAFLQPTAARPPRYVQIAMRVSF